MQGNEQSRVPALSPGIYIGDGLLNFGELLLNVGKARIDFSFQGFDAHTQGLQVRRHQILQQLADVVDRAYALIIFSENPPSQRQRLHYLPI
jgi:hypothetical protein